MNGIHGYLKKEITEYEFMQCGEMFHVIDKSDKALPVAKYDIEFGQCDEDTMVCVWRRYKRFIR